MNICVLAYTFYEADGRVIRYAESLASEGHKVDVLALRRPGQPFFEEIRGVHLFRIQERRINEGHPITYLLKLILFLLRSSLIVSRLHLRRRYSLVHVHSVPDFEVFAAWFPKLTGAKIILDIHDLVPEFYASKFDKGTKSLVFRTLLLVEKLSVRFSDHVIVANDIWRERLCRRSVAARKCTAMINYPDLKKFVRKRRSSPGSRPFVIMYPGTLNWHQGLDVAIKALSKIRDQVAGAILEIYGQGPEKPALKKLVEDLNIGDRVIFHDLVPVAEIARIMTGADLGIVPKRASGFGNEAFSTKTLEFMACGVPVLISRTTIDELYFKDDEVEFFTSEDEDDLGDAIIRLYSDAALRDRLIKQGLELVRRNNWDIKKQIYYRLVESMTGQSAELKTATASTSN